MSKVFTIAEANALLPSLERQLCKLQKLYEGAKAKFKELEMIKAVGHDASGCLIMGADYRLTKEALQGLVGQINQIILDVNGLGCELKHIEAGLVDFPSNLEGEDILLCWRVGEQSISYYHDYCDGFRGRHLLPQELRQGPLSEGDSA